MRGRIVANQCASAPPHDTDHSFPWPCHAYAAPHMPLFQSIEGIPPPLNFLTGMPARCLQMKAASHFVTEGEDHVRAGLAAARNANTGISAAARKLFRAAKEASVRWRRMSARQGGYISAVATAWARGRTSWS